MDTPRRTRILRPLLLPLLLAACATTDQQVPDAPEEAPEVAVVQMVQGAPIEVEHSGEHYDLARVEHALLRQERPEARWLLLVHLGGPTPAESDAIAGAVPEIVAVRPGGQAVVLPYAGRADDGRVRYRGVYDDGTELPDAPLAFRVERLQVLVRPR